MSLSYYSNVPHIHYDVHYYNFDWILQRINCPKKKNKFFLKPHYLSYFNSNEVFICSMEQPKKNLNGDSPNYTESLDSIKAEIWLQKKILLAF